MRPCLEQLETRDTPSASLSGFVLAPETQVAFTQVQTFAFQFSAVIPPTTLNISIASTTSLFVSQVTPMLSNPALNQAQFNASVNGLLTFDLGLLFVDISTPFVQQLAIAGSAAGVI
jgi:hypothetical protein